MGAFTSKTKKRSDELPKEAIQVWKNVSEALKIGRVYPVMAKRALECANDSIGVHDQASEFVEDTLLTLVHSFLSMTSAKDDVTHEYTEDCLLLATSIVVRTMMTQVIENGDVSPTLLVVMCKLLDASMEYYCQGPIGKETWIRVLDTFQKELGFSSLAIYLPICSHKRHIVAILPVLAHAISHLVGIENHKKDKFLASFAYRNTNKLQDEYMDLVGNDSIVEEEPDVVAVPVHCTAVDAVHQVMSTFQTRIANSLLDSTKKPTFTSTLKERIKDAVLVANALVDALSNLDVNGVRLASLERMLLNITTVLVAYSTLDDVRRFHQAYRDLTLKLISSKHKEQQAFGWQRIVPLASLAFKYRPAAQRLVVSHAGDDFVNGTYEYKDESNKCYTYIHETTMCHLRSVKVYGSDDRFKWILSFENDGSGLKMHFVAESSNDSMPPNKGWTTKEGKDSPIRLRCTGMVVPCDQEGITMEHEMARWAIRNKLIDRFYKQGWCARENGSMGLCVLPLIKLCAFMSTCVGGKIHADNYCLQTRHVATAWKECLNKDDDNVTSLYCTLLVSCLFCVSDHAEIALSLLDVVRDSLSSSPTKVLLFLTQLVECQGLGYKITDLPDEVRFQVARVMWITRARILSCIPELEEQVKCTEWMQMEAFRPEGHPVALQSPKVSLIDAEARLVQVTLPIESKSGEFFEKIRIFASSDGSVDVCINTVALSDVEQFLNAKSDRVIAEATLPDYGLWNISCQGLLVGQNVDAAPRSDQTVFELNANGSEHPVFRSIAVSAMDELARQSAGDIHGTIGKLRNHSSSQMDSAERFLLLHTAVTRGRSTLKELKRRAEANGDDDESVPGIAALTSALAEAHLPMKTLEAGLKVRYNKHRARGFKDHISTLLDSGSASWLESIDASDLVSLGGDANRLYQLLIEDKGSKMNPRELNPSILKVASSRDDLFSKKQIKTLKKLHASVVVKPTTHKIGDKEVKATSGGIPTGAHATVQNSHTSSATAATPHANVVTPSKDSLSATMVPTAADGAALLSFLKEQKTCLKGAPESFCHFLVDEKGIVSLNELAALVSKDESMGTGFLQNGNGTVGVKGYRRHIFKRAVLAAVAPTVTTENVRDTVSSDNKDADKENRQPPCKVFCPISRVLMTTDPVAASDGHTYERAAISEYFDKERVRIREAKRQIASGKMSKHYRAIAKRGIVSPVTNETMTNLTLTPNQTVRDRAREQVVTAKVYKSYR